MCKSFGVIVAVVAVVADVCIVPAAVGVAVAGDVGVVVGVACEGVLVCAIVKMCVSFFQSKLCKSTDIPKLFCTKEAPSHRSRGH